jgi:arylsulfatase
MMSGCPNGISRRDFLRTGACATAATIAAQSIPVAAQAAGERPNFIIIFTDDQGYNDLGCFGAPQIKTPNIDRMAAEGMKFTDFYVAAPVCTPSRGALMTGCYPPRNSLGHVPRGDEGRLGGVFFPNSHAGIHSDEITLAELLKDEGYATGCVGKWHLGHLPEFLPTRNGFDSYFGIPYSNDMKPCPVLRGEEEIEEPAVQETLTERYTQESINFIRENKDEPFFLYLAHSMPHIPLFASEQFTDKSEGGLYGDVIETIDWGVGQILDSLDELDIADNTVILFTSDNGPWLTFGEHGGSATPLRAGKGTTYEGGMRVPCVMRWPAQIPAGTVCTEIASTIDVLPTFAKLAGGGAPTDRIIDGKDILPLMTGAPGAKSPHEAFFYYYQHELHAVRSGPWKLRLETTLLHEDIYRNGRKELRDVPVREALYNLETDIGEQKDVKRDHKDIVERLRGYADAIRGDIGDTRTDVEGKNVRPVGLPSGS